MLKNAIIDYCGWNLHRHHYVESVHFSSMGKPLHPAIAVVMTPGREYYILRDTGTSIGSEESGIYPAWMRVIGCSDLGLPEESM